MKTITAAARFLSAICSPLLMGTYGIALAIWLSYLCYSPDKAKAVVIAATFVATCIIPVIAIFLLGKTGVVKDPTLNERSDRTVPYTTASSTRRYGYPCLPWGEQFPLCC